MQENFHRLNITKSFDQLAHYIESEHFKGYDPYDTLTSPLKFLLPGKWLRAVAIQVQKRNPINIRPLVGIQKEYNPKAIGLLLHSYSLLQKIYPDRDYKKNIDFFFNWLLNNRSKGYSGYNWGYNFDWASPAKYLKAYEPTIVVSGFIGKGVFEYYQLTHDSRAIEVLEGICKFILTDLPITETKEGICFSYSPLMKDCCYNASMLGAEILAKTYSITKNKAYIEMAQKAVDFVIEKQHEDGHWNYSIDPITGKERKQIDFHQGYVLDSIWEVLRYGEIKNEKYSSAIVKGASFYKREQFFESGQSKWRLPKVYPVDIHNQAQGIITFCRLSQLNKEYRKFATIIADWTIQNMQDQKFGYFYYKKMPLYTHKTPYMRWSECWMLLALTELIKIQGNKS